MYRYIRSILKNVIDSQGSCFDEKLKIDLTTVHIVFNYIETQQAEIDQLKADRLEMAEAYCYGSTDVSFRLKAQQIIKGIK